jgi:pyruvate dehydrogenase E2 component (dihydrolipoamide acetyltransferase)
LAENQEDIGAFADFTGDAAASAEPSKEVDLKEGQVVTTPSDPIPAAKAQQGSSGSRQFVSPVAKKIATENGVELSSVSGTGPNGRVIKSDVEKAVCAPRVSEVKTTCILFHSLFIFEPYAHCL